MQVTPESVPAFDETDEIDRESRRVTGALVGGVVALLLLTFAIGSAIHTPHIGTANLVLIALVQGLIVSILAMGIVIVYRSSRVINFAIGDLGVPAAAVLGVMTAKSGWPYWPALIFALIVGTLSGTVVELFIIRRLFKAPRVIVLVATIGIAELARAIALALPDYHSGALTSAYPNPIHSQWTISKLGWHLDVFGLKIHTYVTNVTIQGTRRSGGTSTQRPPPAAGFFTGPRRACYVRA